MTDTDELWALRLKDLKARKGHLCPGGQYSAGLPPVCGCGARLDLQPDFMDLSPEEQRNFIPVPPKFRHDDGTPCVAGMACHRVHFPIVPPPPHDFPNEEPPLVSGGDVPPAPFHHANGEPCYGCQSCFANADVDYDAPDAVMVDPMAEADRTEAAGRDVIVRHDAPDMTPSVPLVDPTKPYGPAEIERAILDANRRLELGSKHEANLIAATEQLKIEYELAYARAIERSTGGAADIRKANAVLASEREYRAWHEALAARDAMKAVTHSLRSTVSALQSVGRSVGVSYSGPQGSGR